MKRKQSRLNSVSLFFALIPMTLMALNIIFNTEIPPSYAQTNAAALNNTKTSNYKATENPETNAKNNGLQINTVRYFDNASGYLVYPSSMVHSNSSTLGVGKKIPAVIVIHEFWGINDNIRSIARTLVKQGGYVVLAVDLFKGHSTTDPGIGTQLVKSVIDNQQEAISNLQAAVKYVSSLSFVDGSKIASIGWCFGGGQSLQLALHSQQHPLVATVLYYGTPLITNKQQLSVIKWPILGIFGDHDRANPLPLITSFKTALNSNNITNTIIVYKGLGHAFANPSGANYAPQQTADAWQKTLTFLSKYL